MSDVIQEVADELASARRKHRPMHGAHEGYAVLLEELDELWDEIKKKNPDKVAMRAEALQVAAMAVRFVEDVCGDKP
jgi:hypothetical protein